MVNNTSLQVSLSWWINGNGPTNLYLRNTNIPGAQYLVLPVHLVLEAGEDLRCSQAASGNAEITVQGFRFPAV